MRTRRAADQGYRIEKRSWKCDEVTKESYRIFWQTEETLASGRRRVCSQQGFRTRDDAREYFFKKVVPALRAGFPSPEDQAANERRMKAEAAAKEPTLGALVEAHLEESKLNLKENSLRDRKSVLNTALDHLDGAQRKVGEVTTDMVRAWVNSPARGHDPKADTRIGRYRKLNAVMEMAVEQGFLEKNPCKGIKLPRASKGRMRPLSVEEAGSLLQACLRLEVRNEAETAPWHVCAMVAFSLYTGARADEVMHAHWTDIDWDAGIITIQPQPHLRWTTKNNKARVIRVNPRLLSILRAYDEDRRRRLAGAEARLAELTEWANRTRDGEKPEILSRYQRPPSMKVLIAKADGLASALRRQIESPLVFPNPGGMTMTELPKGFGRAVKDCGLKASGVVFHSLRETFGTSLAKARVDLLSLKTLMGHADVETTMRYIAYSPDYAAAQGARMPDIPIVPFEKDGEGKQSGCEVGIATQPS